MSRVRVLLVERRPLHSCSYQHILTHKPATNQLTLSAEILEGVMSSPKSYSAQGMQTRGECNAGDSFDDTPMVTERTNTRPESLNGPCMPAAPSLGVRLGV